MLTGKRKKVLMFIAIKLNCRMSQLMIQLKVNRETMKFMVCIYSREHLMTLNRNQKNSSSLKGVLLSHDDAMMILLPIKVSLSVIRKILLNRVVVWSILEVK